MIETMVVHTIHESKCRGSNKCNKQTITVNGNWTITNMT